jgi:tungstate transport system substrate-binding protein
METGSLINRRLLMHNDFIILGMSDDKANIKGKSAKDALRAIAGTESVFVSRGDNSGTHMLEKKLWQETGITPAGRWYLEAGTGMGQTLNIANERRGYTIADRGTYLAHMRRLDLQILVEGDTVLLNIYHVMEVNPEKFSKVNNAGAKAFADFLLSNEGQRIIAEFGKDKFGQPLFFLGDGKK